MNWRTFLLGVAESAFSGAIPGTVTTALDPHDWNPTKGKFWAAVGLSAGWSAAKYVRRKLKRLTKDDPDIEENQETTK